MGFLKDLFDITISIGKGVGKGVGTAYNRILMNLGPVLFPKASDNSMAMNDPIRISLIAPSRFGKTSLISTIHDKAEECIDKGAGVNIEVKNAADKNRLKVFRSQIRNMLGDTDSAKCCRDIKVGDALAGTSERHVFGFSILLGNNEGRLQQDYEIQDIPGGWLRESDKYGEFIEFLHQTRILIIPIDATILMEAYTDAQKSNANRILETSTIIDLVKKEWLQYFSGKKMEISLFLVPVKCEAYMDNQVACGKLKEMVLHRYSAELEQSVRENPYVKLYYVPVETIGGIKFEYGNWDERCFDAHFGPRQNSVRGTACFSPRYAELLVSKIFEYSYGEIESRIKAAEKKVNEEKGFWKGKEYKQAKEFIDNYRKCLEPVLDSFEKTYKKYPLGPYEIL